MKVDSLKEKWIKTDENIDKLTDEMFSEVKSSPDLMSYLRELGIESDSFIKNNIATIMSCKDDLDYCSNCPGFVNCNKRHRHYVFTLSYNGRMLSKKLVPCKFKVEDDKKNEAYLIRDFPPSWRSIDISNIDTAGRGDLISRQTEVFVKQSGWIFINGSHRSGKSYMAMAILNALVENLHGKGAFLNYPARVSQLQDLTYVNKQDFDDLIKLYSSVDYLVLDNFGNEYKSEYVRDAITLAILNERARRGLITIFTSEFNFDDIANMYTINAAGRTRGKQILELLTNYAVKEFDISVPAGMY